MKSFLQKIVNHKILIIILIIVLIGLPAALVKPAQGEVTSIVVALGIDKEGEEYRVSIASATPKSSGSTGGDSSSSSGSSNKIVDDKAPTIASAFNKIAVKIGKQIGLEHCQVIVLADSVSGEDCKALLDVLYRKANITLNTILISTDNSAKAILSSTISSDENANNSIEQNLSFNQKNYITSNLTTVGQFFNDYYSKSKVSTMPFLKSQKEDEASDKPQEKPKVENEGETAIFVGGKKVAKVGKDLTSGINFVNKKKIKGYLTVDGVSDDKFFKDATVSLSIDTSKIKVKPEIVNDALVLKTDITLYVEIIEIWQDNNSLGLISGYHEYLTPALKDKVAQKIKADINAMHLFANEKQIDVFGFKTRFYKYKNGEYKKWQKLHNENEVFDLSKIQADVKIYYFK